MQMQLWLANFAIGIKANEEGDRMLPWWLVAIAYIAGMIVGNVLTRAVRKNK